MRATATSLLTVATLALLVGAGMYAVVSSDVPANAGRPAAALTAEQASAVAAALADLRDGRDAGERSSAERQKLEREIDRLLAIAASADPAELAAQAAAAARALDDLERAAGTSPADFVPMRTLLAQIRTLAHQAQAATDTARAGHHQPDSLHPTERQP